MVKKQALGVMRKVFTATIVQFVTGIEIHLPQRYTKRYL